MPPPHGPAAFCFSAGFMRQGREKVSKEDRVQMTAVALNIAYSLIGGIITLVFMYAGYKLFDKLTHFDTSKELEKGNLAVGVVVLGIFVGVGIAIGLVVGLGLN